MLIVNGSDKFLSDKYLSVLVLSNKFMRGNVVKEKSKKLAIMIVGLYKVLAVGKKEFVMSKQLLKSGTSVGANIREAEHAESKADFVHKMAIAQKEMNETLY